MKTNKSYTKRIKVTRSGKLVGRKPHQNHYRAKKSSTKKLDLKRTSIIHLTQQQIRRFLPGS